MAKRKATTSLARSEPPEYGGLVTGISELLEQARRGAARAVNSLLTTTYWEIGRRIVEFEQGGKARAEYGESLLKRLGTDLTVRFGRGFSWRNLFYMRGFYLGWEILQTPSAKFEARAICQTLSGDSGIPPMASAESLSPNILQTLSAESRQIFDILQLTEVFPLSWSHYVRLMSVEKPHARVFYENEAIRGGWSVRQLDRQISTQFFERASHSKQQAALLARGQKPKPEDAVSVEDVVRDPYLLEFLNLKDEYSETDMEDGLIEHLEAFLLELGGRLHVRRPAEAHPYRDRVVSHRPVAVPSPAQVPGGDRPQDRQVHPRRCRSDEPVPDVRQGASGGAWRRGASGHHPVQRQG